MKNLTIYPDIKARAIENPTDEQELYLELTDHGWLDDSASQELTNRRMKELFTKESYVDLLENGETWQFNPDGTSKMVCDKDGNFIR